jgi:hypothetical protein
MAFKEKVQGRERRTFTPLEHNLILPAELEAPKLLGHEYGAV